MWPTFREGERVLVDRVFWRARGLKTGDIVILEDPLRAERILLKRIADHDDGGYIVEGDNRSASRDSRLFGPVRPRDIIGKVILRY